MYERDEQRAVSQQPDLDWFLQSLISLANTPENRDLELGITLLSGGFLISGYLVNGARYFEGFGYDFSTIFNSPADAEQARSSFAEYGQLYKEETAGSTLPVFIHLKDARFFNTNGNPIPGNRGVWWRGRVSEVSGFMVGTLSANTK